MSKSSILSYLTKADPALFFAYIKSLRGYKKSSNSNSNHSPFKKNRIKTNARNIHSYNTPSSTSMDFQKLRGLRKSISNQTGVGLAMAKKLFLSDKEKNIVFSPLSIHVVLSLLAAGLNDDPVQLQHLLSFLKVESTADLNSLALDLVSKVLVDGSSTGGPCLSFGNGFWVDESLQLDPSFIEVVETFYKAAMKRVDIKSNPEKVRIEANKWAETQTKGLIKEVLPPGSVNELTNFVFGNALYFKGLWNQQFRPLDTKEDLFHLVNGTSSTVKVPFMRSFKDQFVRAFDGFKVLKCMYKSGNDDDDRRLSMCLFLPDAKDGLPTLLERVCSEPGFLDCHIPNSKVKVGDFRIPKFKITYGSFEVCGGILQSLGLTLPSKYDIYHKAFVEVNEEGTEAAAVTFLGEVMRCARPRPPPLRIDFVADHPFMFLIMEEKTGAVIFIGQVLNPLQEC